MEGLMWAVIGGLGFVGWMLCKVVDELREHRRVATMYYTREERAKRAAQLDADFEYFSAVEKSLEASDRIKAQG